MANQEYTNQVFKKAFGIIISFAVLVGFVYFVDFLNKEEPLPLNFVEKYKEAITGSREVAEISNSVADKVERVDDLQSTGKISAALDLIDEAKLENEEAEEKASHLLSSLKDLTEMVLKIESSKQKKELISVVQAELIFMEEFIDYTSDMNNFLDSLSIAVVSLNNLDEAEVRKNLEVVNEKRKTINDLSDRFLAEVSQLGILN
jgi:hypothetical protein